METKERTKRIAKAIFLAAIMGLLTMIIVTVCLECIRRLQYWWGDDVVMIAVIGVIVVCAATLLGALMPERKAQ